MIHGINHRKSRRDRAARAIDVERDILLWVLGLEEEELGDNEIRHIVVDGAAEKDNALFEEPRENIVGAFAHRSLFNNHWDEHLRFGGVHIR